MLFFVSLTMEKNLNSKLNAQLTLNYQKKQHIEISNINTDRLVTET